MTCSIVAYDTLLDADSKATFSNMKARTNKNKGPDALMARSYKCPDCGKYHIRLVPIRSNPPTQELEANGNYRTH